MSLVDSLKELGWYLSEEGIEEVSENGQIQDIHVICRRALDFDLRDIAEAAFPEDFLKEPSKLEQPVVVQIQKIRNVSAPKANEESTSAPRMLKLVLHDGKSTCTALETCPIPSLSINTPPGTKILLHHEGLTVCHNVIWLTPEIVSVLGGKVPHMIEKWELNRSLAKHTRGGVEGGPPPWIPFGQRLEANPLDKQFKSLQEGPKPDNPEFEAQRKGAIAEAQRLSGVKKVFGGGTKPLLDANVQKIVDAGFSEEQAENALKYTKNNVDRALRILQKRDNSEQRKEKQKESEPPKRKGRNRDRDRDRDNNNDDDGLPVKPSGKVSLFDFLEDKLPNMPDKEKEKISRGDNQSSKDDRANQDRNYGSRDRNNRHNTRSHGPRHDAHKRSDNRGHYSNDNHHSSYREERKYQTQAETPPRFQKKFEEMNKQHNNNFQNKNHYNNRRNDRNLNDNNTHQNTQPYNNIPTMDSLVEATANLNMMSNNVRPNEEPIAQQNFQPQADQLYSSKPPYVPNQNVQDMQGFRNDNEISKYQEQRYQQRRQQSNGYIEPQHPPPNAIYPNINYMANMQGAYNGRQYGYAARPQEYNTLRSGAPFLQGSLLGFQNAAVNEQARAMLGVADINWK
ncbi:unnamed protein product, partial [Leptidea sinapis]